MKNIDTTSCINPCVRVSARASAISKKKGTIIRLVLIFFRSSEWKNSLAASFALSKRNSNVIFNRIIWEWTGVRARYIQYID
jgi:hypothetical protein